MPKLRFSDQPITKTDADAAFEAILRVYLARKDDRVPAGAFIIPIYEDGFAMLYLGTTEMTAHEMIEVIAVAAGEALIAMND